MNPEPIHCHSSQTEFHGPILPLDKAAEIWLSLNKQVNDSIGQEGDPLSEIERRLYVMVTKLLTDGAAILGYTATEKDPPEIPQPKPFTVKPGERSVTF